MNCPESLELLQRRLDGQAVPEPAALDRHLAACSECSDRHAAAQRLAFGLCRLGRPVPPPGLAPRIAARALAERRARLRWRRGILTTAAVAAGLLLAVLALSRAGLGPFRPDSDDQPVAKHTSGGGQPIADRSGDHSPSLEQVLEEARLAALALSRKTAGETLAQARRWLPPANPLPVAVPPLGDGAGLAPVLDPPAQTFRAAGKSVSEGLKPVTASARRAVDLFLREITPLEDDKVKR
jgi:hypothetical protein